MEMIEIIDKKRLGNVLTKEELFYSIDGFIKGRIPDYQMSSLLMAICINGMVEEEVFALTDIMLHSGDIMDLSFLPGVKVDKHSTGGIGDKTTLVLAPLVASMGVFMSKMSGRGLGYTGGTIDKLESISGFETALSRKDLEKQIEEIGVAIASQTGNLVPADKKLYALRDVTGTTSSIALIAASIMSKKLASGADKFVIDVKVGSGALMKNLEDAQKLANLMVKIGNKYGKETICLLSAMEQPLGFAVGNGLEVKEAIDTLKGKGPKDLEDLVLSLGSYMVHFAKGISIEDARDGLQEKIKDGSGYLKFLEMVKYQNGDINKIAISPKTTVLCSLATGYIEKIDAETVGKYVHSLGAGRKTEEDKVDYGVGIVLHKKVGDFVEKGEILATIYYNQTLQDLSSLASAFQVRDQKVEMPILLYEVTQKV